MEFASIQEVLSKGQGAFNIRGWIKRKREQKNNIFLIVRDGTNFIQCVLEKEKVSEKEFSDAQKANIESSIELQGTASKDERAPNGVEIKASKFNVVSFGEEFPIQKDFSETFLLDVRHLWLRSEKMSRSMKVKSSLFKAYHDFFRGEGYIETQGPSFVSGAVEGGSTLFEVPYFGNKVYLSQSAQFYNEVYIFALEKIYTLAPSFRAEKSRTRRHVTEFWHAEWETAWQDLHGLMEQEERMIKSICSDLLEKHIDDMKYFNRDPKKIEAVIDTKFEKFTYDQVFEVAQKKFPELKWGDDLEEHHEREITKDFEVPIFVHNYPAKLKPFYHRPDPKDKGRTVLCVDMLAPEGYGEIIGSGERCFELNELIQRMKAEKLDTAAYQWYIDLRKYGSVPHAGGGLGLERLMTWIFNLEHIRDAIGFPRTINRYYP
ncbi:MAG TPA: asparagine--tRNA ligase [archaeon]|nr:asparagine--tRNA ligase [archaeon]